jgi:hypothetical protein
MHEGPLLVTCDGQRTTRAHITVSLPYLPQVLANGRLGARVAAKGAEERSDP